MKAYKHLVKFALAQGLTVSVWDGGEWGVKRSSKYKDIIDHIESVDTAELRLRDGETVKGWALIIPDLEDDETVADYSDNEFFASWEAAYNQ